MSTEIAVPRGSLRELEAALYEAEEEIAAAREAGVEVPATALATVQSYALAVGEKREAVAVVLRDLDGQTDYANEQVKYWQEVARLREARATRLRGYVLATMLEHGVRKVRGVTTTFSVQQNPPSVEVDEPAELPRELLRYIPERVEPDKRKIADEWKAGREVPGTRLVPGSFRLVVR